MTLKRILSIPSFFAFLFFVVSCSTSIKHEIPYFPGEYPAEAYGALGETDLTLSNQALEATWKIVNQSIVLSRMNNKYDGQTVDLENISLFALILENGQQLTNLDFQLQQKPEINKIAASDSLPTQALRFAGKEICATLVEKSGNIAVRWTAELRDGSNYIRQNIRIKALKEPVKISKVIFFDGSMNGASYAGSVLGSPIQNKNFFFAMEHPIAHSTALMIRNLGSITQPVIDLNTVIDGPGEYVISEEHGSSSADYNIEGVSLLENNNPVATDRHRLNGTGGNSFYHLKLDHFDPQASYQLKAEITNPEVATGTFHIHRKTDGILNFYVTRTDELFPGKSISEWAVMGVSPEGQNRRAFQYYLERERARPYKQFLHYNCWWDITDDGASSFTSEQLIERMHAWNEKFITPFNVQLNAFVFDDGWDNLDSVWYFDPVKFPTGFAPQAELCKQYNSGIGVWMSPFGGYLEAQQHRIRSAQREGLETNDRGLSLAGPNYYKRFEERALDMLNNYKVNYFKFDGFGGSNPQYLPDMEAGASLIKTLRSHNPDVFVNITVGSWPSPFWLQYADCTWRGSGDLHMAGEGSRTQKFMIYRDGTLHNNIVSKAPNYPLNSIMTVGIAYANLGHPIKCINDSIEDFRDMVWSSFAAGSALQELYISHDRMKPEFWPILAEAAQWAKANQDILKDTHWIGGSPINLEVYGFASWLPEKGIISLRNPSNKEVEYQLLLHNIFEIPEDKNMEFDLQYPLNKENNQFRMTVKSKKAFTIRLKPFETWITEALPLK